MSDDKLRELERRWRETGAIEDEGRVLRERVRAGRLDPQRLRLAAECGYPGACAALGREPPINPGWREVRDVLRHAGRIPAIRVAATAAGLALDARPTALREPVAELVRSALRQWARIEQDTTEVIQVDRELLPFPPDLPGPDSAAASAVWQVTGLFGGRSRFFNAAAATMRSAVAAGVPEERVNREALTVLTTWALGDEASADRA